MRKYPEDAHLFPRMENNWICFPDWCWRKGRWFDDITFRICAWIGETFFDGYYCFTVDRNKEDY